MKDSDKLLVDDFCGGFEDMEPEDLEAFEDGRAGDDESDDDLDAILKEYGVGAR